MCTGGNRMKKLIFGTMLMALVFVAPIPTMAEVSVHVGISLPPPIVFASPPELVVLPETYVYVVPDAEVDIFFYNGWWWRPWEGHWYRSRHYGSGWVYYRSVPSFYRGILYPQIGGMSTGRIVGEGINGITSEYLISSLSGTGAVGNRTGIGRSNRLGESRV
jgi:hypothetical protein